MIVTLLRKPLEGTVAENTLKHGCGSINIDATRVSFCESTASYKKSGGSGHVAKVGSDIQINKEKGRWPANFILTRDEDREVCPIEALDEQSGVLRARGNIGASKGGGGMFGHGSVSNNFGAGDEGGASRFFKHFKKEKKA
mgnify:CR=1 FL=1|tara:strand:- start:527 stop:949 length:423 start_codon:yes stop_codon:yes gene_type:complete